MILGYIRLLKIEELMNWYEAYVFIKDVVNPCYDVVYGFVEKIENLNNICCKKFFFENLNFIQLITKKLFFY